MEVREELPFGEESTDDKVYGSRWSNLFPAYRLLKEAAIGTPDLYASGTLTEEGFHYAIFDYLSGDEPDYSEEWFSLLGHHIGVIHLMTRSYQGWVSMTEPFKTDWKETFDDSMHSQLAQTKKYLDESLHEKVSDFMDRNLKTFKSPDRFVLSHTDGIQAIFKKTAHWECRGAIDIEDYQFTDQRFVLAGMELITALEGHSLPEVFWKSYSEKMNVDPSYQKTKSLFQAYYLLVWIRVLQGQGDVLSENMSYLEKLVK